MTEVTEPRQSETQTGGIVPRWLDVERAAVYTCLSDKSIRRLISSGKLTARRPVRGKIVLDRFQIDAYVGNCTVQPRTGRGLCRQAGGRN